MRTTSPFLLTLAVSALAASPSAAQSLEGSKWSIDQEGVDAPVVWWLGSQGRVRTGDIGTILPGYHWEQKEDSLFVSVGDTLRYSGILMANRLVGVRTGPRRQEGWWSGARADAATATATAVAQAPSTPAATEPGTEQMARPVDPGVSTPATTNPTAERPAPRTLRRIERADGGAATAPPASPAAGGGREIRRLNRPGRAAPAGPAPAGAPVDAAPLLGRWVARNPNLRLALEIRADSTATFTGRNGTPRQLRWTAASDGIVMTMDVTEEGDREVVVRQDGAGIRMQGRGMGMFILMDRAPAGASLEPAVRQP
jgi:hypothetical protein